MLQLEFSIVTILTFSLLRGYVFENTSPNKVQTTLIYNNADGYLSCSFNNASSTSLSNVAYSWTYHGHSDINSGRIDFEYGSLHFERANAQESGLYECWISGTQDSKLVTTSYSHRLVVYELPELTMEVSNTYKVPRCIKGLDEDTVDKYTEHLCDKMEKPCPYAVEYECISKGKQTNEEALNYPKCEFTVFVTIKPPSDFIPPPCDAPCVRKALALRMKMLKLRIQSQWHLQFEGDPANMDWYREIPETEFVKIEENCPPGFVDYEDSVCAPCEPGFYWSEKTEQCIECPMDMYSSKGASTKCIECPSGTYTQHVGSTSKDKCKVAHSSKTAELLGQLGMGTESGNTSTGVWVALGIGTFIMLVLALLSICCWYKTKRASRNDSDIRERLLEADEFEKAQKSKKKCGSPKCKRTTRH